MQQGELTAFLCMALSPRDWSMSNYEKELLVIFMVVSKWKHYLEDTSFVIKTDWQSIRHLLEQKVHASCRKRDS